MSEIKCDFDALYHGDVLHEEGSFGEDVESPAPTVVVEGSPLTSTELFRQQIPAGLYGWETA